MKKVLFLLLLVSFSHAFAADGPSSEQTSSTWWTGNYGTGDWFGVRTTLEDKGVEISGGYTAEVWGNTTGGLKQGAVYTGLLDFGATVDLEKLVGWKGASVSTTWLWLSGRDASEDLVGNFLTISNIAGFNTLRMLELWFQQDLFLRGDDEPPGLSIRVGQITADSEFVISDYGALFTNGTFGWPAFLYTNVPEGGPGYPMGTLGVRVAVNPWDWVTVQSAVFQGNVFAQDVNRHGFRWDLDVNQGYFWINEIQGRWNQGDDAKWLPGQAKFGAWFHTADFADPFVDENGVPLADEGSSGNPQTHQWNYGFYWILDQMLYREPSRTVVTAEDGQRTEKPFLRKDAHTGCGRAFQSGPRVVRAYRVRAARPQFRGLLFRDRTRLYRSHPDARRRSGRRRLCLCATHQRCETNIGAGGFARGGRGNGRRIHLSRPSYAVVVYSTRCAIRYQSRRNPGFGQCLCDRRPRIGQLLERLRRRDAEPARKTAIVV